MKKNREKNNRKNKQKNTLNNITDRTNKVLYTGRIILRDRNKITNGMI